MNIKVPSSPGSPDEAHRQLSLEQKRREAQRIKEVEAIDADEQTKRWQMAFQQAQGADEAEDENEPIEQNQSTTSIFDTKFNSTAKSGIDTNAAIPSPSYSSPPDLTELQPESMDVLSDDALPQSEGFYEGFDSPKEPLENPQYQQEAEPDQSLIQNQSTEQARPYKQKTTPNRQKEPEHSTEKKQAYRQETVHNRPPMQKLSPEELRLQKQKTDLNRLPMQKQSPEELRLQKQEPALNRPPMQKQSPEELRLHKQETVLNRPPMQKTPRDQHKESKLDSLYFQAQQMRGKPSTKKEEISLHGPAALPTKKGQQLEPSPFGPPGKGSPGKDLTDNPVSKKEIQESKDNSKKTLPKSTKEKKEEDHPPMAMYWTPGQAPLTESKPSLPSTKEILKQKAETQDTEQRAPETKKSKVQPFEPNFEKAKAKSNEEKERGDEGQKQKDQGGKTIEITPPSLPGLPIEIQPMAQAATVNAAPYLRPEIIPIFYQMIGNITLMASPRGISHTEFLLNNPAFANSKFYGASISITRYSTAPDAFNICLSGSNEAVTAFNQSIPSLLAAFQTGGHKFRIGRIETEYKMERPLVQRKEAGREKGEKDERKDRE